jgi:hypothetical protein
MVMIQRRDFVISKNLALVTLVICVLASIGRSNDSFPSPDNLPAQSGLPDPLVMLDGRKVTNREMWINERRPELIRLFQHCMYGQLPPQPKAVSGKVERVDVNSFDGKATLSEVTIRFGPPEVPPIHLMLVVPNSRTRLAPVVLGMNYFGNHTLVHDQRVRLADNWMPERGAGVVENRATEASRGSWAEIWRIEELIDRGYAVATFYNGDIDPDTPDRRGLQEFFPAVDSADACGTIGAWAWGLQRAVDYLVSAPGIDPRRIVVTGHSRLGKAALVAAAFDERIALVVPHQAGCGGSAPSRARVTIGKPWNTLDTPQTKRPETVTDINQKFPHWFNPRFKEFNDQPERLPFDQNCLVALCAPRPVLFTNGRADTWINPAGQFEVLRAAAPVYRLLGAGGFSATELPPDGNLIRGVLGYSLRPGGHSLLREDWKTFLDFADLHLGKPSSKEAGHHDSTVGPILIDKEHHKSFLHQNGERFFPMGDTAYFLMGRPAHVIAHYIDVRRTHGFNFIRMMAMADGFWPFGGAPENPDYTVLDEAALRKMDWVFDYAAARGMTIELILWGYGVAGGEGLWRNELHEHLWVDTLVKRYRDRQNLFMYTIANEFERYPDGQYRYDPADVDWARRVAARIRKLDAVHHIGCHPSVWITDQDAPGQGARPFASYKGFTQRRPPVVWPLWEGSDVNLNVTQNNEGVQRRAWGNFDGGGRGLTYSNTTWQGASYPAKWTPTGWDFEAAGLEDCIAADWARGKPVLVTEFGYQYEPGYEAESSQATHQVHQPSSVRRKAWKIATAGGYFAAGFAGTAVSRDWTNRDVDNFRPAALGTLYEFFTTKTEYWKLSPHLELVSSHNALLALPGVEYIAYFPRGGANSINLAEGSYRVDWLHPESGNYFQQPSITVCAGDREFTPPHDPRHDWVLHLLETD